MTPLESKLQALVAEWRTQETRPSPSILGDIQFSIYEARKACANELEYLLAERQEPPREADWEAAAKQVDWMQILLNLMNGQETGRDGQPCFFIGGGRFCGRAKFWDGHIVTTDGALAHRFVSLLDLLTHAAEPSSGTGERK